MNTTIDGILAKAPKSVSAMLESHGEAFYTWQSENVDSGGYAPSYTARRDRYERCANAAMDGSDGSTHAEHIEDFAEYAKELFREASRQLCHIDADVATDAEITAAEDRLSEIESEFAADIARLTEWHEKNGSLDQQCA